MNMNIFSLFTNIFIFVICGGMFVIIPQLTRKSYLFGVRIPPEEAGCEEAVKLKKAYVTKCIFVITVLLAACVVQFIVAPEYTLHATLYSPLLIAPLFFIIYIPNWKKAVMLKAERGWAVSNVLFAETKSGSARGNLSNLPWVWYAISLVIVVLSVALAVYRMPHLPDLIPVHFNAAGEVTRYTEPTWFYVMIVPLANASLVLVMLVSNIIIERAKLQIDSNK
ncbi:MAG: DUF1648 domain-containing protein, partial [Defluviitaleaceae bacterium]|nr:DUF1648 domain-containing protein [Defluviitaleaceae bacterium]